MRLLVEEARASGTVSLLLCAADCYTTAVLLCVWGDVAPAVLHLRYLVHPPQTTCIDRERHSLGQSSPEVGRSGLLTFSVTHKLPGNVAMEWALVFAGSLTYTSE